MLIVLRSNNLGPFLCFKLECTIFLLQQKYLPIDKMTFSDFYLLFKIAKTNLLVTSFRFVTTSPVQPITALLLSFFVTMGCYRFC